jgi:hypothetical protein
MKNLTTAFAAKPFEKFKGKASYSLEKNLWQLILNFDYRVTLVDLPRGPNGNQDLLLIGG